MGNFKFATGAIAGVICLSVLSLSARAETAPDLYAFYGKQFISDLPEDVYSTINSYHEAEKLLQRYRYVQSAYDMQQDNNAEELRSVLSDLARQLKEGFYLPEEELARIESLYSEALVLYNNAVKSSESFTIDSPISENFNVPTTSEYKRAMSIKAEYDTRQVLGNFENISVFSQAALVDDYGDDYLRYVTTEGNPTLALFNGEIVETGSDYVLLNCYNGIELYYVGLNPSVRVGSTVYQGKVVGYSFEKITLFLKLNGDAVSLYDFLEGDKNEDN